jgi:branched-chain amino acid transport system substrate-binding protein
MNRRRFLTLSGASVVSLAAARRGARAQSTPAAGDAVKIGVLNPTTGQFTVFGEQVNAGIELYFEGAGAMAGTLPVELIFADTAGEPQQALEQARRLVGEEGVHLLMGVVNSAAVPPLAEFAGQERVPFVFSVGGAQVATGPDRNPYVFRTALVNGQQDRVLGWYTAETLGKTKAATFAWDFLVGEERVGGFSETFTAAGGEIVTQQKPPLGTTDYGPFISQIDPSAIDVIYAFFAGPGALAFMQQLTDFGISPNVPVVASDYFTAGVLAEMGDVAEGLVQAGGYVPSLDTDENKAFVEAYRAKADAEPGVYVEEGYTSALVIAKAIEAAGGMGDEQAFLDALAAINVTGPAGPLTFDDHGQAVRSVYLSKVEKTDDVVVQTVIDTVEEVSQDWTPS